MRTFLITLLSFFLFSISFSQETDVREYYRSQKKPLKKEFKKAFALQEKEEFKKAIKVWTKTIDKDPSSEAYYHRGMCYMVINEHLLAMRDFLEALPAYPESMFLHHVIAGTYLNLDQNEKAAQFFEKAIQLGLVPNAYDASHIGTCYYFTNRLDSAAKYLEIALEGDALDNMALNNLGWVYLEKEDYVNAKRLFERLLEVENRSAVSLNNLGFIYHKLGDNEKARSMIMEAKSMEPENSFVYRNLAYIYQSEGDKEQACKNLEKAISLHIIERWGMKYVEDLIPYCE
jgi:tetratricopeptide (TPR) repeat protein